MREKLRFCFAIFFIMCGMIIMIGGIYGNIASQNYLESLPSSQGLYYEKLVEPFWIWIIMGLPFVVLGVLSFIKKELLFEKK